MMERIADRLPRHRAKFVIAYYLLTMMTARIRSLLSRQVGFCGRPHCDRFLYRYDGALL